MTPGRGIGVRCLRLRHHRQVPASDRILSFSEIGGSGGDLINVTDIDARTGNLRRPGLHLQRDEPRWPGSALGGG